MSGEEQDELLMVGIDLYDDENLFILTPIDIMIDQNILILIRKNQLLWITIIPILIHLKHTIII
jgi:hypothetical protein